MMAAKTNTAKYLPDWHWWRAHPNPLAISYTNFRRRVRHGWSRDRAIATPCVSLNGTAIARAIALLEATPGMTCNEMRRALGNSGNNARRVLEILVERGVVRIECEHVQTRNGRRPAKRHYFITEEERRAAKHAKRKAERAALRATLTLETTAATTTYVHPIRRAFLENRKIA